MPHLRLLLIEDDPALLRGLSLALSGDTLQTTGCKNLKEARTQAILLSLAVYCSVANHTIVERLREVE